MSKTKVTFKYLCKLEPRLKDVENAVKEHVKNTKTRRRDDLYCANRWWYGYDSGFKYGIKQHMSMLVGWERQEKDTILGSSEAYAVAYHHLYDMLPCCKHDDLTCGIFKNDAGFWFAL